MTRLACVAALCVAMLTSVTANAQCTNLPAGCPSCTMCTYAPVTGTQPSNATINGWMEQLASNSLGAQGYTLGQQEQGASRTRGSAVFPCVLFKGVAVVESSWKQFCTSGLTVISFDCGYGISQITSGASTYGNRIASEGAFNISAGANILIGKWNADTTYGGHINDSTPTVVENWYYAVWAYNGFVNRNNPNYPQLPATRPPFGGPGALSRGSYPYQELVWGRIRFPLTENGNNVYNAVQVTYPNNADIPPPPTSGSLFVQNININPQHDNPCSDPCAGGGCPNPTELIVDNLDPGFSVVGSPMTSAMGGYRDSFLYAVAKAAGQSAVVATFTPDLPADGVWEVAGYIPLTPATSADIPVAASAVGGTTQWLMDQTVTGGVWQVLGQAKLRAGHTSVRVADDSGDTTHNVGMDAIRWRWVGHGGPVAVNGACADSTECSGSLMCSGGHCVAPCWEVPCAGGGTCAEDTGACGPPAADAGPVASSSSLASSSRPASSGAGASSSLMGASSGTTEPPPSPAERPWWKPCSCAHASTPGGTPWLGLAMALLVWRLRRARPGPPVDRTRRRRPDLGSHA